MSKRIPHTVLLCCLLLGGCSASKQAKTRQLYNATWELEYITGPRIAFKGLFPDKVPQIEFDEKSGQVRGNSGCNGYSADYTLEGDSLSFGQPGPSTLMYCGEGEQVFRKTLRKIENYDIDADGNLVLLMDGIAMMRFHPLRETGPPNPEN